MSWDTAAGALGPGKSRRTRLAPTPPGASHAGLITDGNLLTVQTVVWGGKKTKEPSGWDRPGAAR